MFRNGQYILKKPTDQKISMTIRNYFRWNVNKNVISKLVGYKYSSA